MKNRVMIVDDDPAIRKVIGINLEKSGFEVMAFSKANDALVALKEGVFYPDCILLDIRMPGMSGIEFLVLLKKEHPNLPVIMLTALTDLETAVDTMRKGAFDYVVKPVRKIQLVETIKKAIRYGEILLENERLAKENLEYQRSLEKKVEERTRELILAYKKLKQTNLETVKLLAETIEAKDPYTRGHCNRVRKLSVEIANLIGFSREKTEALEYGALLHDVGKIGITEKLLHKNGPLNESEKKDFQRHTIIGETILSTVEFFRPCLKIVRHHHEWYNGNGYPDGLKGEEIDIEARIVAISDSYDAMTSTRPYRKALSTEIAIEELKKMKGKQFDPELVDLFIDNKLYMVLEEMEVSENTVITK